jgi:hypothetical protein
MDTERKLYHMLHSTKSSKDGVAGGGDAFRSSDFRSQKDPNCLKKSIIGTKQSPHKYDFGSELAFLPS